MASDFDLGWACGFFEGEGCFSIMNRNSGKQKGYQTRYAGMNNTDRGRLVKFQKIVGVGHIIEKKTMPEGRKQQYIWQCTGFGDVEHVINMLYDGLGPRRRAQARKVMAIKPLRRL